MLRCEKDALYTGITVDVKRRMREHFEKQKSCAKYTLNHTPQKLEAVWQTENRILASKMEFFVKKLKKSQKEVLIIKNNLDELLNDKIEIEKYTRVKI